MVKITSEECIPENCVNGEEVVETGFWWAKSKDFGNTLAWMSEIKMNLQDIGWNFAYLIHVAQDTEKWRALANMLLDPSVAENVGKLAEDLS
jgi:hypothetical protein